MSYRIVRYTPEFRDRFIDLEQRHWSRGHERAVRYFEWKYPENPYAGESPDIYLALAGDEVVGARGFYRSRWESGQGAARVVTTLPVADDFFIAPEHRNRGLASLLMRTALDDLARRDSYVLNLSGSQVTVLGSLAMGWRSAGPLEPIGYGRASPQRRFREFLGSARFLWRLGESRWLLSRDERWPFRQLDRYGPGGGFAVEQAPPIAAMCELIERLGHDGSIRHLRDPEYLAWRYRSPLSSYRFLCYGSGPIEGYLVLQVPVPWDGMPARIVDLEATSPEVQIALIDRAFDAGRFRRCFAWGAMLPATAVDRLTARGWYPIDQAARAHGCPCILVKSLRDDSPPESWLDRKNWDLRMIDTMAG